MRMNGYTNEVYDIKARVCDGSLQGVALFYVPTQNNARIKYDIKGTAAGISSSSLQNTLMNITDAGSRGTVSASFDLMGEMGEGTSAGVKGSGTIKIKDGTVFRMPVFGPLSGYMSKIIPGLDFMLAQTDAKADVVIADGKASSKSISVEGEVISMRGDGSYSFDGEMDYQVRITLMKEHTALAKLLRAITYPISKLFEFQVEGSFDDPKWYPVNFSKDLLEKLGLKGEKKEE